LAKNVDQFSYYLRILSRVAYQIMTRILRSTYKTYKYFTVWVTQLIKIITTHCWDIFRSVSRWIFGYSYFTFDNVFYV